MTTIVELRKVDKILASSWHWPEPGVQQDFKIEDRQL